MNVVCYNFASAGVITSTQNLATIQIVKSGKVIAIDFDFCYVVAATVGTVLVEVVKQGASGGTGAAGFTNNPQREILLGALFTQGAVANGVEKTHKVIQGLAMDVKLGDILSLGSRLVTGTAFTTGYARVGVYVAE